MRFCGIVRMVVVVVVVVTIIIIVAPHLDSCNPADLQAFFVVTTCVFVVTTCVFMRRREMSTGIWERAEGGGLVLVECGREWDDCNLSTRRR